MESRLPPAGRFIALRKKILSNQVRQCYLHGTEKEGSAGKVVARMLNTAVSAGKRARSETSISRGTYIRLKKSPHRPHRGEWMTSQDSFSGMIKDTTTVLAVFGEISGVQGRACLHKDVEHEIIVESFCSWPSPCMRGLGWSQSLSPPYRAQAVALDDQRVELGSMVKILCDPPPKVGKEDPVVMTSSFVRRVVSSFTYAVAPSSSLLPLYMSLFHPYL